MWRSSCGMSSIIQKLFSWHVIKEHQLIKFFIFKSMTHLQLFRNESKQAKFLSSLRFHKWWLVTGFFCSLTHFLPSVWFGFLSSCWSGICSFWNDWTHFEWMERFTFTVSLTALNSQILFFLLPWLKPFVHNIFSELQLMSDTNVDSFLTSQFKQADWLQFRTRTACWWGFDSRLCLTIEVV